MKILAIGISKRNQKELNEFFSALNNNMIFSTTSFEAIKILNREKIDVAIIEFNFFDDLNLLKYLNQNFKHVKVILTTTDDTKDFMNIIREADYKIVKNPFRLGELRKEIFEQ